jgi:GTP 3',8-cyclase
VAASVVGMDELDEATCRKMAEGLGARFRWRPYDRLGRIDAGSTSPIGAAERANS